MEQIVVVVVVVSKLQRDLDLVKFAIRRWLTVAALTVDVIQPPERASLNNRVFQRLWCTINEELFTYFTNSY